MQSLAHSRKLEHELAAMQIRPYKTTDNKIDGATLSRVDIDTLKHHINEAEQAKATTAEREELARLPKKNRLLETGRRAFSCG